jgi:hypothetical protein
VASCEPPRPSQTLSMNTTIHTLDQKLWNYGRQLWNITN